MSFNDVIAWHSVICCCCLWANAKGLVGNAIPTQMHPVYGDKCFTSLFQLFGVRSCLVCSRIEKVLMNNDLAMRPTTSSQRSFFIRYEFTSLSIVGINAKMNTADMLKNKCYCFLF